MQGLAKGTHFVIGESIGKNSGTLLELKLNLLLFFSYQEPKVLQAIQRHPGFCLSITLQYDGMLEEWAGLWEVVILKLA